MFHPDRNATYFNSIGADHFPELLGIRIISVKENCVVAEMPIHSRLFAPNDFVHAGSLVTLADTVAGYSVLAHLPETAKSFTTLELKSNFIRGQRAGTLVCSSSPEHLGRTTQVWRAIVSHKESGKTVAIFSCTQMILY